MNKPVDIWKAKKVKKLMIAVALTFAVIGCAIAVTAISTQVVADKGGGSDGG
jgi:hypothetical protein